jgi:acyl-CoA synthetase (AMP-forming)/AMP-acid ligase II
MSWFDAPAPLLPEILARHGRHRPHLAALICGDTSLDWAAFSTAIERIANACLALGLQPGERVAILMANGLAMPLAMFGALRAGLVAVPLNTSVPDEALARMLEDCDARAVIVTPEHRARIDALHEPLQRQLGERRVCTGAQVPAGWYGWQAWVEAADSTPCKVDIAEEAVCSIIYSSGTTGLPKGIALTHRRRLDWAYDLAVALRYHGAAVTLCSLGLYSNISWVGMLCTWLAGGTVVVMPGFDAAEALATIERHRVTHFSMVPVQYQRLLECESFGRHDIDSLQAVMCCGSPLDAALKRRLLVELGCDFIELYGLTEGLITTQDPEHAATRLASVGRALPGTEIRIIGEDDAEMPAGQTGEIVGRGRILMAGYLNRDDANAESTWTDRQGARWLRTGDIGRLDDDGNLYVVDRKKDMILSGGQNIYPADIEAMMLQHPAVAEIAVIGVASARWGETPLAVVVARQPVTAEALRDWTNARVGRQQRVSGVVFTDALPRNPNGKILKRELRTTYHEALG